MAYQITTSDGTKVRATIPHWIASQLTGIEHVNSETEKTKFQKRELHKPVLIQNDKRQFTMVPRYVADGMIDSHRAVEIEKDVPEFLNAWDAAHGFADDGKSNIQVKGVTMEPTDIGREDFMAQRKQLYAELSKKSNGNGAESKAAATQGVTESGIHIPEGADTSGVPKVQKRGRPRKVLPASK